MHVDAPAAEDCPALHDVQEAVPVEPANLPDGQLVQEFAVDVVAV